MKLQHRWFRRISLLALLALLGAGAGLILPPDRRTPADELARTGAVAAGSPSLAAAPLPAAETPALRFASLPPPPAHLREVFPELPANVHDWRRFIPERLVVRLAPGLEAAFRLEHIQRDEGRTVLTARLDRPDTGDRSDLDMVFLVGVANRPDHWDATIVFAGIEYRVEVAPGRAAVRELPMRDYLCGTEEPTTEAEVDASGALPVSATDGATGTVDVAFFYNAEALADRGNNASAIDADCAMYIGASNSVLRNSGITTFTWRYAGAFKTPDYPRQEAVSGDLSEMFPDNPLGAFIVEKQLEIKADQAVLLVGGTKTGSTGVAWVTGPFYHSAVNYPFPTSPANTRGTTTISFHLVCHELAHNFGCRHGRDDPVRPGTDGDGLYHYGHTFVDSSSGSPRTYATLMASGNVRIPLFSNPEIRYRDHPTGVPVGEPRAAYNAKVIAEQAARLATVSDPQTRPVFVAEPADITVAVGQPLTLSAEASGGGAIAYFWAKNGTGIQSFEGSTYTIASVTTTDAGTYKALAVNLAGHAYTREATVTVTATDAGINPPATPPGSAAPGSGGGGGGGGSLGGGLAATGLALALLRAVHARRSQVSAEAGTPRGPSRALDAGQASVGKV